MPARCLNTTAQAACGSGKSPDYIIVSEERIPVSIPTPLIETSSQLGAFYAIAGFPPIKAAQQAIYSRGSKYAKR